MPWRCEKFETAKDLRIFVSERVPVANAYWMPNRPADFNGKKPTKDQMAKAEFLWVDLDPIAGRDWPKERQRILEMLVDDDTWADIPRPTFVIDTGGGYAPFWKLTEPVPLNDREGYEAVLQGLCAALNGDSASAECSRVMRLPFTTNFPDEKKRQKRRMFSHMPTRMVDELCRWQCYDFDQFAHLARKTEQVGLRETRSVGDPSEVTSLEQLQGVEPWLAEAIGSLEARDLPEWVNDRSSSGILWATCLTLLRAGNAPELVMGALTNHDWQIGKHIDWRPDRARRQVAKAARKVASERPMTPFEFATDWTDLGNSRRLERIIREHFLYCYERKRWFLYEEGRWRDDPGAAIEQEAQKVAAERYAEAMKITDEQDRKAALSFVKKCCTNAAMKNAVSLSRSALPVCITEFDADDWLLNLRNCTLDLRTLEARPHSPDDMLTKMANADYDPDAGCPEFERFLAEVMMYDDGKIDFVQRAFGYSLTGSTEEHCFFILFGNGANGKSTLMQIMAALMGDYLQFADSKTFMQKPVNAGPSEDLAALKGARAVIVSEIEQGRYMDEPLIKDITGGEKLAARFLYENQFTYKPTCKIWMQGNHRPRVHGQDEGIWRRIRIIDFLRHFTEAERDARLAQRIIDSELSGVLNWAVRGLQQWQESGTLAPEGVANAAAQYRKDCDTVGEWFAIHCDKDPQGRSAAADAWQSYQKFCEWSNYKPLPRSGRHSFSARMQELGFGEARQAWLDGKNQRCYGGFVLVSDSHDEDSPI